MIANKIKTLIFPVLNLLAALLFTLSLLPEIGFIDSVFFHPMTSILGIVVSGLVPIIMIVAFKLDTSEFFSELLILYISTIPVLTSALYSTAFLEEYLGEMVLFIGPGAVIIGYFMYRLHYCFKNWKTTPEDFLSVIVITLSPPGMLFIGILYDFNKTMEAWCRLGAAG